MVISLQFMKTTVLRHSGCALSFNLFVRIFILLRDVLNTTLCNEVCQWLVADRWFSPDTSVSSIYKTDCHDFTEILLKVALNIITLTLYFIAHSWFDSKIIRFRHIFISVISLTEDKMVPVPCKSNGKYKEFQNNFLKIYRYLNLLKNQRLILYRAWEKYLLLIFSLNFEWNGHLKSTLKGCIYYNSIKNV